MDPVTAIGLASAIVQFVDFSTKIIHSAKEIYDSATGSTEENQSLEYVVSEMQHLSQKLDHPPNAQQTDDERALSRLAAECKILSDQILGLLTSIKPKDVESKPKDVKSKRQVVLAALKNMLNERDK